MKRVANHKVFKTVMAWFLALVVLVTTVGPSLPASADSKDYNKYSVTELLDSEENLTWVFAGDSITHNATFTAGMNGYGEWFEQYLNSTGRDKDSVIISAWGGQTYLTSRPKKIHLPVPAHLIIRVWGSEIWSPNTTLMWYLSSWV